MFVGTQSELVTLFEKNPRKIEVCFNEDNTNGTDRIFIDYGSEVPHGRDNRACYINKLVVNVYCYDSNHLQETMEFFKEQFVINPIYTRDDEFNICSFYLSCKLTSYE